MTKLRKEPLEALLRAHPGLGSAELCARLGGINRATLARMFKAFGSAVVSVGNGRRTRYAMRRALRGSLAPLPLFRIDQAGQGHQVGELSLLHPAGSALSLCEPFQWPLDKAMADGWFDGLPYPLYDMRPQGFLGRHFARHHALDLGVPENPDNWSDDDIVHVLANAGYNLPGNLILGETAYRRYLKKLQTSPPEPISDDQIALRYPQLAADSLAHGVAGSSAAGEFPKFTASRIIDGKRIEVIVKFSGADASPAVRRWSDLLVCEQIAAEVVAETLQIESARSRIHCFGGRTFLEVPRFDRIGVSGRQPACSLASLNAALIGASTGSWPEAAKQLANAGWLPHVDAHRVALLWWFGKLIANTDMHEGNLSFYSGLKLAPVYDMLPMLYAPMRGGELPERFFVPPLPLPKEASIWQEAALAGVSYWGRCAEDLRIGESFRKICEENRQQLVQAASEVSPHKPHLLPK